jgi:hypothetical protein
LAVGVAVVTAAAALALASCHAQTPRPITIQDRSIAVENQTPDEWQNVEVWVNDHYRVTKTRMAPRERFSIPLDAFVAGFGQRFNPVRQVLRGIEVTASTAGGHPVRLVWGTGRRR